MKRVLLTGASGGVGTRLRQLLKPIYPELILSDLKAPADLRSDEPKLEVPEDVSRFDAARAVDRRLGELRRAEVEETADLAAKTDWKALAPARAASTVSSRARTKIGPEAR